MEMACQTDPVPDQGSMSQAAESSRMQLTVPEADDEMDLTIYSQRSQGVELITSQPSRKRIRTLVLSPTPIISGSSPPPELGHFIGATQGF